MVNDRAFTLNHVCKLSAALPRFQATASINARDFSLEVRGRNRFYRFVPQFFLRTDGRPQYSPHLSGDARGFCGWLPYFNKGWPIGASKFAFKEYCAQQGLPTPRAWRPPATPGADYLLKQDKSSFGAGMRGPFRANQRVEANALNPYYEEFVSGRILKIWYWEDQPACVELMDMPCLVGDGRTTVQDLIAGAFSWEARRDEPEAIREMAAFQGFGPEAVLGEGQRLIANCRYGSFLHPATVSRNVLEDLRAGPIGRQLAQFGPVLFRGIPEELRPATLYTVDGIVDAQDKVWLLEMNCNPLVHPDAYFTMLEGLFGKASDREVSEQTIVAPPPPPASALPPYPWPPGARVLGPAELAAAQRSV